MNKKSNVIDMQLWTDELSYAGDFLGAFSGFNFVKLGKNQKKSSYPTLSIRHDVDWSIQNALSMARIENELGISSTYYLINPDGFYSKKNYFGEIHEGFIKVSDELKRHVNELTELGHDVGLHNDILSASIVTGTSPRDLMDDLFEQLTRLGLEFKSTVAHGSRFCSKYLFNNYNLFNGLIADSKKEEVLSKTLVNKDWLFGLDLEKYGFLFEANFLPKDFYISDSSAKWTSVEKKVETVRFDKFQHKSDIIDKFASIKSNSKVGTNIHALVHACHWSTICQPNESAYKVAIKRRNANFKKGSKEFRAEIKRLLSVSEVSRSDIRQLRLNGNITEAKELAHSALELGDSSKNAGINQELFAIYMALGDYCKSAQYLTNGKVSSKLIATEDSFEITLFDQGSDITFVTFNGTLSTKQTSPFGFKFLLNQGFNLISVNQDNDDQYQSLDFDKFRDYLSPYVKEKKVFTYGSSLGGYAAIYYAGAIDATVIASGAMNSAHPQFLKGTRFENKEFKHVDISTNALTNKDVFILVDPLSGNDIKYVENIYLNSYPNLRLISIKHSSHRVIAYLSELGYLKNLISDIVYTNDVNLSSIAKLPCFNSSIYCREYAIEMFSRGNLQSSIDYAIRSLEFKSSDRALWILCKSFQGVGDQQSYDKYYNTLTKQYPKSKYISMLDLGISNGNFDSD